MQVLWHVLLVSHVDICTDIYTHLFLSSVISFGQREVSLLQTVSVRLCRCKIFSIYCQCNTHVNANFSMSMQHSCKAKSFFFISLSFKLKAKAHRKLCSFCREKRAWGGPSSASQWNSRWMHKCALSTYGRRKCARKNGSTRGEMSLTSSMFDTNYFLTFCFPFFFVQWKFWLLFKIPNFIDLINPIWTIQESLERLNL